jgi:hypothetical protein
MEVKGSPAFAIIIGLVFFSIGAFFSYSEYVTTTWDIVDGTIDHSKVAVKSDSDGTMYRADVKYSYNYGGKDYLGNCCSISSSFSGDAQSFVDTHKSGETTDLYVNPDDPSQSRIKDDVNQFEFLYVVFMLVGGLTVLFGLYLMRKSESV